MIGILEGAGGISDMATRILAACRKHTGARVIVDTRPERLIERCLRTYHTLHAARPSCFHERPARRPAKLAAEAVATHGASPIALVAR
jgi:hypothetical protein